MDNSFMMIFDLISTVCGGYILFTYFKLRIYGRLFPNSLLIPKDRSPKDCADPEGYIQYIGPRLLITGIPVTAFGLVMLVNEVAGFLNSTVILILTGVAFLIIMWLGICSARANRLYW